MVGECLNRHSVLFLFHPKKVTYIKLLLPTCMEYKGVSPKSAQKEKGKKKDLGLKALHG